MGRIVTPRVADGSVKICQDRRPSRGGTQLEHRSRRTSKTPLRVSSKLFIMIDHGQARLTSKFVDQGIRFICSGVQPTSEYRKHPTRWSFTSPVACIKA